MLINADLTQTPDVRQIVRAGIYRFQIQAVSDKPPKDPNTKGMNIVLDMKITQPTDSIEVGRELTYYCFIPSDARRADAFTNIKRVFLSAGIPVTNGGMNTAALVGREITASVTNGVRHDPQSGMTKETYGIGEVYIPTDNVRLGEQAAGATSAVDTSAVLGGVPQQQQAAPQQPTGVHPSMLPGQQPAQQAAPAPQPPLQPPYVAPPGAPIAPQVLPPQMAAAGVAGLPPQAPQFAPPQA